MPHSKTSDNIHNVIYTDIQFCKFQFNVDFISAISNILDIIHDIIYTEGNLVSISEAFLYRPIKKKAKLLGIYPIKNVLKNSWKREVVKIIYIIG